MTAPSLYQQEMAKRGRGFSVYLSDRAERKKPFVNNRMGKRSEKATRDATWAAWYDLPMTCAAIAERWEKEQGQKCYGELVRRALKKMGVKLRPPGWRRVGATPVVRIAALEAQLASVMERLRQLEEAA